MVVFEGSKKGVSSGLLWQDSAVSAARLTERYIHQEEQFLHLSELHTTSQVDYERNGSTSQLLVTERGSDSLNFPSAPGVEVVTGCLPGTSFMYRFAGPKLWIWDALDRSGERSCQLVPFRFDVVSVGLAESQDSACKIWLIVATEFEVSLLYFSADTLSAESPAVLSGYVAATGGVRISAISPQNSLKRIFLGGEDGSVYELIYKLEPTEWSVMKAITDFVFGAASTDRRCYLSIIHRPMLIPFISYGTGKRVITVQTDACRQLLYVASANNLLSVFDISGGPGSSKPACELDDGQISEPVKAAFRTASWHYDFPRHLSEIVEVIPSNPHIGGEILCILVTRSGARVFVKGSKGRFGQFIGIVREPVTKCVYCERYRQFLHIPTQLQVVAAKVPERTHVELNVAAAYSPDNGRTVIMVTTQGGIAIVQPEESSIAQRQQGSAQKFQLKERFDFVPVSGAVGAACLLLDSKGPLPLQMVAPSDSLMTITTEPLLGGLSQSWRFIAVTPEREIQVSPLTTSEQLMNLLKKKNLHSIRDFAIQYSAEQLGAVLMQIVSSGGVVEDEKPLANPMSYESFGSHNSNEPSVMQLIERILFNQETASALGLVELSGLSHDSARVIDVPMGPLGSVVQNQSQYVSGRSKGFALALSRLVRPIWFHRTFAIEAHGEYVNVRPALNSAVRTYIAGLLKRLSATVLRYRYQLSEGGAAETKLVEGFIVLVQALGEMMELMRLFETGQLNNRMRTSEFALIDDGSTAILDGVSELTVRDIAMSAGVGEPVLLGLVNRQGIDTGLLKKHCPLLVPK